MIAWGLASRLRCLWKQKWCSNDRITLIIIAWSLLLLIYLGNANVRASVIAQNSDEPPIDEEPLTTNETLTEDLGDNQTTELQQQPMQPGLNATDAGNATTTGNAITTEEPLTTNDSALNNKGAAVAGLGRYEEAIGYYDRVLNIDPNYIPALVNKGAALGNLGRHQEAMEYFETTFLIQESSITTAPDSSNKKNHFVLITNVWGKEYSSRNRLAQYYSNVDLGNLQLDNLRRDKEETYALHFISHGYEIEDINKETNTGIAKFNLGDCQEAIATFNEILRLHEMRPSELVQKPELVASLYNKGLCLEKLGNLTGAEQYKNQAHNVDPNYKGGYVLETDFSAPALDFVFPTSR
jgi:tetratricopeptide (TPR) repeat protein